jgi:hypothetical protein
MVPQLNPYKSHSTSVPSTSPSQARHWLYDAVAMTWASLGLALAGLLIFGAWALTGNPCSLLHEEDAYIGVSVVPYVVGFAAFGSVLGAYFRSRIIGLAACFLPLTAMAAVLWLSDYYGDLGEGEQVATYIANGLFIGELSIVPAFLCIGRRWSILMMTLPHLVAIVVGIYFVQIFGR